MNRFRYVVKRAILRRSNRIATRCLGGHDDHGSIRIAGSQTLQHRNSIHIRQANIEQDEVRLFLQGYTQAYFTTLGFQYVIPFVFEKQGQGVKCRAFVFDDEDSGPHAICSVGSSTSKRAPLCPFPDRIDAPILSNSVFVTASPSPVPPALVV